MRGNVIVLGGDGFCGWLTALHLSQFGYDVTLIGSFETHPLLMLNASQKNPYMGLWITRSPNR